MDSVKADCLDNYKDPSSAFNAEQSKIKLNAGLAISEFGNSK